MKTQGSASGVIEHVFLVALLAFVSGLFVQQNILWRWDNLLYDTQLSLWSRTVSDDIIIIAIDDESLNDMGRWPWPRSTHAKLINKLELESPRAIGLDIIFSEPDIDNPASDTLLAKAMQASGKVVLPVFMSQESSNSYPIEDLPIPAFTEHAAALGHVQIDISNDGFARRVYLREGIGEPYWMHYSLAVLSITNDAVELKSKVWRNEQTKQYSAMQWSREYPFLIPYAGPAGHFKHIGYSQVMSGNYAQDLFRDKIVLIGTTAEGLGDALPTPVSGSSGAMPGVEIIANMIDAISNDHRITELEPFWLVVITILLVSLPVLIYPYLNPGATLLVLFSIVIATLFLVALLLWIFGVWLPVSTILLFQFISYPLWSWRRLAMAMRHINTELDQLTARQKVLSLRRERNITDEINFISELVPIDSWVLQDEKGFRLLGEGNLPPNPFKRLTPGHWNIDGRSYWAQTRYLDKPCVLGLNVSADAVVNGEELRLLNSLINTNLSTESEQHARVEDVLQAKIQQVHAAGTEYEELRRIIDDSLSGMAGVLICSSRGQVMLSNRRAGLYLYGDDEADINGESFTQLLKHLKTQDGGNWKNLLQDVMFKQQRILTYTQHEDGRDLLVEISPLRIIGDVFDGFVVNFSDISRLKASERKRSEVLNFLSHDLRSPLSSMIAMIELTRNKTTVDEMREMLQHMETNTQKTLHLAEQFLQLSRANADEKIDFYDIDFNSVVLNAIDQLWALSNKMEITITHKFDRDELWTYGEPGLLERAILNLLSNAIKYSPRGATVCVNVQLDDNEINCCVIDQGAGISAEELPHLFELFKRTKESVTEQQQGIGLGLSLVDAVARRHSGRLDVESKLGEGSTFCLRFPRVEPVTNTAK